MKKCVLLSLFIVVLAASCHRAERETRYEGFVNKQCDIIWAELRSGKGVFGEVTDAEFTRGVWAFDLDGDGCKEILAYVSYGCSSGGKWWLFYYKDGIWHKASDTPFMCASYWDFYFRGDDDMTIPRLFYKKSGKRVDSASAVIFDREKGAVTLEPFDFLEFQDLKKRGLLLYEDAGQDD